MWLIAENSLPSRLSAVMMVTAVALSAAVLFAAGCGGGPAYPGPYFPSQEKLAYLMNDGSESSLILTAVDGGGGVSFLRWPETSDRFTAARDGRYFTVKRAAASADDESRRFSFSNDGRYLAVSPKETAGPVHRMIVATDGSHKWDLPAAAGRPAISPDSSRLAYLKEAQDDWVQLVVLDLGTGAERVWDSAKTLAELAWADEKTLVYSQRDSGFIYRLDLSSGEKMQLTPPGRSFSLYAPAVSFASEKIALLEIKENKNIWSLDVKNGGILQVTNNSRFAGEKRKATYLPARNVILFQEPEDPEAQVSTDLCLIGDDGGDFSMLTTDYFFDGLYTVSLASGKIAWQHAEETETSVWVSNSDGSEKTEVAASETAWLGDPNFAPVRAWLKPNPLDITVNLEETPDTRPTIVVTNPTGERQEAVLRLFPGPQLTLVPLTDADVSFRKTAGGAGMELSLNLEPGAAKRVELYTKARAEAGVGDATLLVTLAVPEAPPIMFWRDLGSVQGS